MSDPKPRRVPVADRRRSWMAGQDPDALAEITPDDIQSAAERFRRLAPRDARELLDAETIGGNGDT